MTIRLRKDEKEAVIAALPGQREPAELSEEWRPIPDFPGYDASSFGRVRSWRWNRWGASKPKVMKQQVNARGYAYVRLRIEGRYRNVSIHILVAGAFIGPRPGVAQVRHLDGNQRNNVPGNLAYGTHRRGDRNPMSRLTPQQVAEIRDARIRGEKCTAIARRFGVSHQCISDITNGRRWAT